MSSHRLLFVAVIGHHDGDLLLFGTERFASIRKIGERQKTAVIYFTAREFVIGYGCNASLSMPQM